MFQPFRFGSPFNCELESAGESCDPMTEGSPHLTCQSLALTSSSGYRIALLDTFELT